MKKTIPESNFNYLVSDFTKLSAANEPLFSSEDICNFKISTTDNRSQRLALLRILEKGPCHTIAFRELFGICAPAPRIYELRHDFNYNIQKRLITTSDNTGVRHNRVALYYLLPGQWREVAA